MQTQLSSVPPGHGLILKNLNVPWCEVLHLACPNRLHPGDTLGEGSSREEFYFIASGRVRMTCNAADGTLFLMAFLEENCLCGDAMVEAASRSASFQCLTKVSAYTFDKSLLLDPNFVREHPRLYINLLQSFSIKLTHTFASARAFAVCSPMQRVCSFFLNLRHEQGDTPRPDLTHEELAAFLGMHRSTLTRALSTLREEGTIGSFTRKRLEVFNWPRITALAGGRRF